MLEMDTLPPVATNEDAVSETAVHAVEIETLPIAPGARSGRYRVWYRGEVLVRRTRDPEHDACRALADRGIFGLLKTRWRGKPTVAMRMDIAAGARLTVEETARAGAALKTFYPVTALEAAE